MFNICIDSDNGDTTDSLEMYFVDDFSSVGWCKVSIITENIFIILFSFYMAMDIGCSIGNKCKYRLFIQSIIIIIYSFLSFSINTDKVNNNSNNSSIFLYDCIRIANIINGIICLFILFAVICGCGTTEDTKPMDRSLPKLCGSTFLITFGMTLMVGNDYNSDNTPYKHIFYSPSSIIIPCVIMLIYDFQYL